MMSPTIALTIEPESPPKAPAAIRAAINQGCVGAKPHATVARPKPV